MKLNKMQLVLKKREVMEGDKFYLYTYVNIATQEEIVISKQIPRTNKVVIEGDNNEIVLPIIPDELVVTGSNNKVVIKEEDIELEVPFFLTPEYKKDKAKRDLFNKIFNR